ncbi:hypothetical protein C484_15692 [Natrialba taiwanensis DSM 12281]|uniref:Cohesin domain-containing protein n=1 Tax=Natrialba taiwanensis DSM 12281 TaxID=1230458 RepID=L9ZPD2_9EURY|nr:hypothetical protein C484_15692 [Natrialba taiwanensis DSM 12281]
MTPRLFVLTLIVVLVTTAMAATAATAATPVSETGADAQPTIHTTSDQGALLTTNADETLTLEVLEETDETITVAISSTAADTAGFQANLSYDPDATSVADFAFEDLDGMAEDNVDPDTGHLFLTESVVGADSLDEPTLATVTFTVGEDGLDELEFVDDDSLVSDSDGEVISGEDDGDDGESPPASGGGGSSGDDDSSGNSGGGGAGTSDNGDENGDNTDDTDGDGGNETDDGAADGGSDESGDSDGDGSAGDDDDAGTTDGDDSDGDAESDGDDGGVSDDTDGETTDDGNGSDDEGSDGLPGFTGGITLGVLVAVLAVLGATTRRRD